MRPQVASPKEVRKLERNVLLSLGAAREALRRRGAQRLRPDARRDRLRDGDRRRERDPRAGGHPARARAGSRLAELPPERPRRLRERPARDLARHQGPELRRRLGLRDRLARDRRGGRADQARRRRRRPRRRRRGVHAPADPRRLHARCAGSRSRTRTRRGRHVPSTRRAPGSSWAKARACSCSRSSTRRERAARRVYAEVLGYGASNDAHHMAQPEPEATGVAEMMRAALRRAGVEPERVGYINAHGTSTPLGDLAETKAIKDVFGDHAYELAVSSTKSMMGHTLRRGRRDRGDDVRARHPRGRPSADDQLPTPRSRLRPRLRAERGARGAGRRRALQRDGPRRPQRLRPRSDG